MIEVYGRQIIKFLAGCRTLPVKRKFVAKSLQVSENNYADFEAAVDLLASEGKILLGGGGQIGLPAMSATVKGVFRANERGFGFVVPSDVNAHGDLFIAPGDSGDAMSGDTVTARSIKKGIRRGVMQYNGVVVKVIERGIKRVVGRAEKMGDQWVVHPDGKEYIGLVSVDDVGAKGVVKGDKVCVEIIKYPSGTNLPVGVITEVLGRAGLYDTEIKSIIMQHQLPAEFSAGCIDQARSAAAGFDVESASGRDDISDDVVITIDPPDAKDFDDAISLVRNGDGNWVLGVHIADVSSFIGMDSALDVEAKDRGNSIYLPGKVIPMLPEILSNGICSLQPNQKRFAKSAYITYDDDGNVLGRSFSNSIICSRARLTYHQADEILKGKAEGHAGEVVALLKDMETLARAIEQRRFKKGMLHLELPECELVMDEKGRVVDAHPADDSYPHTIIEMFMIEANEAVASLMDRFNIPFMRRIHPDPDPAKMKDVSKFVRVCGLKLPRRLDRRAMQDLLEGVKGTARSFAVNMHILRSLAKAEYAPLHIGHFALASTNYAHFTSPIRRYADLMLHRLLGCYIDHQLNMIGLEEVLPDMVLSEVGQHISFTEQRAVDAERELKTVLILQMLSDRVGDELDCVVSGLTNSGVFVQCLKFGIEGMIEFGDLGLDEWKFDKRQQVVVGKYSSKKISLGEEIRVRIASVSVEGRKLYVAPSQPLVSERPRMRRKKAAGSYKRKRRTTGRGGRKR